MIAQTEFILGVPKMNSAGSHRPRLLTLVCWLLPLMVASAQELPPLQANTVVRVTNNRSLRTVFFSGQLNGGPATFSGSVSNLPGGDTAFVALRFDYRTSADIALDEIIARIEITVEDLDGNIFSTAAIDPNTIHLNPNRVPLYYSATLYKPAGSGGRRGYFVRTKVFGNYE